MAGKGVELASAYISLSVNTDGVPGQIKRALNGSTSDAQQAGTRLGTAYANAIGKSSSSGMTGAGKGAAQKFNAGFQSEAEARGTAIGTKVGTVIGRSIGTAINLGITAAAGVATAAVGGIGYALFKGLDRYKSLDATNRRLRQMGKSGDDVKQIIGDINSVVEGTPIALDDAASAATKFLQGGVKQGQELKDVLTAIADASGMSGENFGDLAIIFGQVMNKGKLQAEEMLQFNERNINIQAMLRKEFGWTGEELDKLSKDSKISFDQLIQAVEGSAGGMAKAAGDTIDGALSKMQSAVARVGSNFIAAIFGDPLATDEGPGAMAQAINNVTAKINELDGWVKAHQGEIKQFFTDAAETARTLAGVVGDIGTFLKEHPGLIQGVVVAFGAWKTIQGVAALSTALSSINTMLGTTLPASTAAGASKMTMALGPVAALVAAIAAVDPTQNLPGGSRSISDAAKNGDWGSVLFGDAWPWIKDKLPNIDTNVGTSGTPGGKVTFNPVTGEPMLQSPNAGGGSNFTNPNNVDTGGKLTTATQNIQSYLRGSLGFQGTIGGWRAPDGFNEHSSGKASDVMVSSTAEGNALLPNLLRQPGVQYILWNQRQWNPDGTSSPMEDRGSPTQNHMDHLHVKTYDTGGWLPPGMTLTNNQTGQPELILNPEQVKALAEQGVDPNTLLHGQGQGAAPGPVGVGDYTGRTEGYIPAAAGNTAPVGTGGISSLLDLGESAINNLIDAGAQAASMAATAAIGAGSFGAGAAAGPAASAGIQMGAQAAKRGVQYGFDLAGIWGEALVEQLTPFGAPRWLGSVSPTAFMPQQQNDTASTSLESARQGVMSAAAAVNPTGRQVAPGDPAAAGPAIQEGAQAVQAAQQQATPAAPAPTVPDPFDFLHKAGIFDSGGWLQPGSVGVNLSNRPEAVFTGQQFRDINKMASAWETSSPNRAAPLVGTLQALDMDDAMRKLSKAQRLEAMTYQGRP